REGPTRSLMRRAAIPAAVALVASALAAWFGSSSRTARTIAYTLMIQKTLEGQPDGAPFIPNTSAVFQNGWKFRLRFHTAESGSLYLLAEAGDAFQLLFPLPSMNAGIAPLAAGQTLETEWYIFDGPPGTDKVWLLWSPQPLIGL